MRLSAAARQEWAAAKNGRACYCLLCLIWLRLSITQHCLRSFLQKHHMFPTRLDLSPRLDRGDLVLMGGGPEEQAAQ